MAEAIIEVANIFSATILELTKRHGFILALLIFFGVMSILGYLLTQGYKALRYFFIIVVIAPAVIILSLVTKQDKEDRKRDLGEIKAYIKEHPDRWKKMLMYIIAVICFFVVAIIVYFFITGFVVPISMINEMSINGSINWSNVTLG